VRDEQGFEELYAAVFGRLVGQLDLVTGDLQDAEDAVQEALNRAAVRWGRLRAYAVPEAWVRRGHELGQQRLPPGPAAAGRGGRGGRCLGLTGQ
jgi:predicted RNA polymerase sigma factor